MESYRNSPAPKAPAPKGGARYDGDPSFVLPRKSSGPAVPNGGPKKTPLNMKSSGTKMPKYSGVVKA